MVPSASRAPLAPAWYQWWVSVAPEFHRGPAAPIAAVVGQPAQSLVGSGRDRLVPWLTFILVMNFPGTKSHSQTISLLQ